MSQAEPSKKVSKSSTRIIKDETGTFEVITDEDGDVVSLKRLDDEKDEKGA